MKYSNPNKERTAGFIAQELKSIFPELVSVTRDTTSGFKDIPDVHSVNYAGLTPFIVKGMQEQQQLIQTLQSEIADLKKSLKNPTTGHTRSKKSSTSR